jgi:hypothetical protein
LRKYQQRSRNKNQQAHDNKQPTRNNKQPTRDNKQPARDNKQPARDNSHLFTKICKDMQPPADWGGTRTGKTKTPNVGKADNRREAATDWNAGIPPASVLNRTGHV